MRRRLALSQPPLVAALLVSLCLGAASAIAIAIPLPGRDDFNIGRWEVEHLPGKWLYLTGRLFRGELSEAEANERLGRFLELTARVRHGQAEIDPAPLLREREALENDVEAIVEGRLAAVLEDIGLDSSLPLFPDARWVFPPVDAEFDRPPQVLSVSPRERIELVKRRPLRPDLPLAKIEAVERQVERDGRRSALVEPVSGAATYPSIVEPRGNYRALVETVAHEWVHQYLFFKPLGRRFYSSLELRTLNETVADLAGRELAELLVKRYPLPPEIAARLEALEPAPRDIDVGAFLRRLRREVDGLLARGRVEEAEALMEERRQELAGQGVVYRRINQAFFAFRNVYGTDPASVSPIGAKVEGLRSRADSVAAFLHAAARLTSEAELDEVLAGPPEVD